MKKNIVLFSKEFETAVFFDKTSKKFRYHIDNPFKNCIGARATILPSTSVIETVGGIDKADMFYGFGIKIKQDVKTGRWYYEFDSVVKRPLSEYFLHTGNVYVDKNLKPLGSAVGFRYQYEENFICK